MVSKINQNDFELTPFNYSNLESIRITGTVYRHKERLKIKYILSGDLSTIIIPQPHKTLARQYDLWEHTCFEFFLRIKDTAKYWEFNLSPSGKWNVFRFLNYRENIAEELKIDRLPFSVERREESLRVELNFDLNKIKVAQESFNLAIATVVEDKHKQLSYWALTHPKTEADFHHPDSFALDL